MSVIRSPLYSPKVAALRVTLSEQVDVDYDELPAVAGLAAACGDGAALVWDDAPGNVCFDWEIGDAAATDEAFANAAHISSIDIVNNRLIPNAIEPRAGIGDYDSGKDEYTLYTTSQNPHVIRLLMGAYVLGIPGTQAARHFPRRRRWLRLERYFTMRKKQSSPGHPGA